MSKKLATICDALVLDVKVGSGAFMKTLESGHELAQTMVEIGEAAGVSTVAMLTDMSIPLGLTAGNALGGYRISRGVGRRWPSRRS
jgi:thymidine phosphorylase